jgi:hypothetical protein
MLTWSRRPRREENELSHLRIWQAKGAPYSVIHALSKYGLPPRFVAMVQLSRQESPTPYPFLRILSNHRTQAAAMKACERHARLNPRRLA